MNRSVAIFVASLLFLTALCVPLFFIGWWGYDALLRRRILVEGQTQTATLLRKTSEWGGRAYGTLYYAEVRFPTPHQSSANGEARIPVTEEQYAQLQPGSQVAVRRHPAVARPGLLAGSRWWSWAHVGWISFGVLLLGYLIRLAAKQVRPRPVAPGP